MAPRLIFGTASFGMDWTEFQDPQSIQPLLQTLLDLGIHRLDTGARYPPLNPGRSEELIGEAKEFSERFVVDTKVYTDTRTDGSGDLSRDAVRASVSGSLQRLQRPQGVNVLYAHRADPATPLSEQIQAFDERIVQGHCKAWGVSNTPPAVLEEILQLCDQNGWTKPSCYQGSYNLITRGMETKLLPLLRKHVGMLRILPTMHPSILTYLRPLAAGFLTGKFINNQHTATRFDEANPLGKVFQNIFSSHQLHEAMKKFDAAVREQGLTSIEVALRWICHHSLLGDEDGVILGASKTEQIVETVRLVRRGPLPASVLGMVKWLWDEVKGIRGEII